MESETKIRVYGVPIVLMMLRGACLPSPAPYASIISTIGTGFWLSWDEEESKHKKKTLKKRLIRLGTRFSAQADHVIYMLCKSEATFLRI